MGIESPQHNQEKVNRGRNERKPARIRRAGAYVGEILGKGTRATWEAFGYLGEGVEKIGSATSKSKKDEKHSI